MSKIILASQSPRRKQLLEWAEIDFEVVVSNTDEKFDNREQPSRIAQMIALEKATAVSNQYPQRIILAADTIVVIDQKIIGKPHDRGEAVSTLQLLNGHIHEVITGVAILHGSNQIVFADTTKVEFHKLSDADLEYYVDQYKPYDKAGAYAIQEWIGVRGIKCIEGDFYNVMGLPVSRVVQELEKIPGFQR